MLYLLLLLLCLFGCRSAAPIAHRPDTLVLAVDSSPTNLDPRIGIDKVSEDFHRLLFNGLLRRNEQNRMVPDLASSFEKITPVLYRFKLHEGVRFHDGKLLDADDVVFTYRSIFDGSLVTTKKAALRSISSVRALDSRNVEILLSEPFNGLLSNLNLGIVPKGSNGNFAQNPIGTGPYRLRKFQLDAFAYLEAFPQYYEGSPKIRFLNIRVIPDATTRVLELRKGAIDLMMGIAVVPPDALRVIKQDPNVKTMISPGNNYTYIGLNLRDPILKDRRIRQAIGYAIGRDSIIQNLFYGAAVPATGLLPPYHWAYEKDVMKISHDQNRARRMLDEAGYRDPDGDGPQKRFWLTLKISMNEFRRVVASVLQSDLESVGIGVKIRSYEWSTFFSDINRGNFQLCMLMWVGENDPDLYREIFSSSGARNRGKYEDRQVDEWVGKARVAATEEEQKYYYSMVQKKVAEDCPYISLWYESNMALMRKELGGLRLTPDVSTRVLKDVYWIDRANN